MIAVDGGVQETAMATSAFRKLTNPDISDVVQSALEGDAACRLAIEHAGEHIGIALAIVVNLVSPSVILVDGAVTRAGDLLLEPIRRAVSTRSLTMAARHMRVAHGELGDNAIAMGGVASVLDAAFAPSAWFTPSVGLRESSPTVSACDASNHGALHGEFSPLIRGRQRQLHVH